MEGSSDMLDTDTSLVFSNDTLIGDALGQFFKNKHFGKEALEQSVNWLHLGPIRMPFPNLKARREAIYLHDITHIVTSYDTSWVGEGEVAAYELASGFPAKFWIGYIYPPITFAIGFVLAPRRVLKAFRRGWRQKNVYQLNLPKKEIMQMTIDNLRKEIDLF